MRTIDANVILRYLTNDVPDQAKQAEELLKRVEAGTEDVFLPDIILADIIFMMTAIARKCMPNLRKSL